MASVSFSLGGPSKGRKASPPPPRNGVKRVHASLGDDDSDEEDVATGKRQNVTHFDLAAGGAVDVTKPKVVKEPLVIKRQANRDWKEASQRKRQKYGLPSEAQASAHEDAAPKGPEIIYGLDARKRNTEQRQDAADAPDMPDAEAQSQPIPARPKTDQELALDALLGKQQDSTLTIPAVTEEEAYERDYHNAPDAPTLDEYTATPVEEFGAAMLRGMGWREGQGIGNQKGKKIEKAKVLERRPALLGIGAKPDAAVAAELGAWGQGAKGKKRVDITYNPLVLRNAKTGEQLTEDELKVKMQQQTERDAEREFTRGSDRDRDRKEQPPRKSHRDDFDSEAKDDRRRKDERRRDRDGDHDRRDDRRSDRRDDKHRSRRDRSTSYDRHRSRRDRSASYDRARDKRTDKDYDDRRVKEDRREKDSRRKERDDYDRERTRRDRYDDDRDRDSRRHRR